MTKSGEIAGPKVLEHIVDVVLYLEVGTTFNASSFLFPFFFWSKHTIYFIMVMKSYSIILLKGGKELIPPFASIDEE